MAVGGGACLRALAAGQVELVVAELADGTETAALDAAGRLGVPRAGWLRDPEIGTSVPAALLERLDGVFVTDPALAWVLEGRTGRRPVPLPEAASSEALAPTGPITREDWIAVLPGSAGSGWAHVLRAAADAETVELPADPAEGAAALRSCAALIAAPPAAASQLHVPAAVFDAVALDTPVVMPVNRGAALLLPRVVARAAGPRHAAALVTAALDGTAAPPVPGATVVRNAHTHGHRLATMASALGIPVLPGRARVAGAA